MKKVPVQISGTCQLIDYLVKHRPRQDNDQVSDSRLTGIWRWQLEHDSCGFTDINGTAKLRSTTEGIAITGVIRINMAGVIDDAAYGSQILFLAYRSTTFQIENNKTQLSLEGRFTGGIGNFKDADGLLVLSSCDGQITTSTGHLLL